MSKINFSHTDNLLNSNPFDFSSEGRNLFLNSFIEMASWHYEHNDVFRYMWEFNHLHPRDLKSEKDLENAPFMMINQFKEAELKSVSSEDIVLTLGSSGTGGQRSLMHLDQGSLDRVKKLAYNIHEKLGMTHSKKYNYLCFTYDPKVANDLGTAFTDELLTSFTGIKEVYYTFQFNDKTQSFEMNEEEIIQKLIEFSQSDVPTRILGFPAFLYKLIKKYDLKITLPEDSWLQTGGGWKAHAGDEIPKFEFRKLIADHLGIKEENQRDLFGMVEHGIPYVDCENGHLRIPNFARIYIRDPFTLEVLPKGKKGLVQFMCSYNSSYPSINLLSTDWGMIIEREDGLGDELMLLGRAGISKHKGCALKALEEIR